MRTIHWHQRSVTSAAARYNASVWAMQSLDFEPRQPFDHALRDHGELWNGILAFLEHDDEIALWLPQQAALLFGDAMLRRRDDQLRVCPDSGTQPADAADRLRTLLGELSQLSVEHVRVSHGPLVTGGARRRCKPPSNNESSRPCRAAHIGHPWVLSHGTARPTNARQRQAAGVLSVSGGRRSESPGRCRRMSPLHVSGLPAGPSSLRWLSADPRSMMNDRFRLRARGLHVVSVNAPPAASVPTVFPPKIH